MARLRVKKKIEDEEKIVQSQNRKKIELRFRESQSDRQIEQDNSQQNCFMSNFNYFVFLPSASTSPIGGTAKYL